MKQELIVRLPRIQPQSAVSQPTVDSDKSVKRLSYGLDDRGTVVLFLSETRDFSVVSRPGSPQLPVKWLPPDVLHGRRASVL